MAALPYGGGTLDSAERVRLAHSGMGWVGGLVLGVELGATASGGLGPSQDIKGHAPLPNRK